jgi:polyhydroxybutyrate depolymerase
VNRQPRPSNDRRCDITLASHCVHPVRIGRVDDRGMDHHRRSQRASWSAPVVACATIAALALGAGQARPAFAAATARSVAASMTTTDGRTRTYRIYVPRSLPRHSPVPLLVALHGGFGSGMQFEENSGFDALADVHHFIVVYPDGTPIRSQGALANARVWNGGRCCGPAARQQVDDVGFIRQLIDAVSHEYDVDSKRIYAAGHSNGAIMSYRLACELSDKIVAIGVQAGSLEVDSCRPTHPVSVLHIHGSADRNIPISGGKGDGLAGIAFNPPRDAASTLANVNGCHPPASAVIARNNPDVSIETWKPCHDTTEVQFVTVAGASHAWMGHPSTRVGQTLTGAPYMKFDSSAAIWAFLAAHPRA